MARWIGICGIYAIVSSIAMLVLWIIVARTGFIGDDLAKPVYLAMLIIAEGLTAMLLFVSGLGLLKQKPIGMRLFPMAMGMLIYATLFGAGKFGQKGEPGVMVFLLVITLASVVLTGLFFKNKNHSLKS